MKRQPAIHPQLGLREWRRLQLQTSVLPEKSGCERDMNRRAVEGEPQRCAFLTCCGRIAEAVFGKLGDNHGVRRQSVAPFAPGTAISGRKFSVRDAAASNVYAPKSLFTKPSARELGADAFVEILRVHPGGTGRRSHSSASPFPSSHSPDPTSPSRKYPRRCTSAAPPHSLGRRSSDPRRNPAPRKRSGRNRSSNSASPEPPHVVAQRAAVVVIKPGKDVIAAADRPVISQP